MIREAWEFRMFTHSSTLISRFSQFISKTGLPYFSQDPANISTSDQRCFNVADQRWNNVDPTLKMKQNPTSTFQRCTTLIQRRCATLKQRWYNFISTLFQLGLNNSKSCIQTSRAIDKYWFAESISTFYSAKYFEQYISNSTTNKLVNSYSNFLTFLIEYKGKNGESQKSSKL